MNSNCPYRREVGKDGHCKAWMGEAWSGGASLGKVRHGKVISYFNERRISHES
jgi:hypothetical protein